MCIPDLPKRMSCSRVQMLNSSMHTTHITRRTCRLVSTSSLNQQVFPTHYHHQHLPRPRVFLRTCTKTHGAEPNMLITCHTVWIKSVFSQSTSETSKQHFSCMDLKQIKQLSHHFLKNLILFPLAHQNASTQCRLMYHHFSTRASYSTLKGDHVRSNYQSPLSALYRMQAYGSSAGNKTGDPLSPKSPEFRCYMDHLTKEHQAISESLQRGDPMSDSKQKELRGSLMELGAVLDKWEELTSAEEEITELQRLIEEPSDTSQDKEMQELAAAEKDDLDAMIADISEELVDLLLPSEETDDNDVIMEFTAGVGGQEAMLFAADMFEMYQRYAAYRGWTFSVLEYFTTDMGGLRHASVSMSGDQAYLLLRQEAGVHRVQRVPRTESKGRIHTSTMAIAVLPQPKEIDLKLDPKDLRVETKKASGAGGQHVNTTDSAVRITHLPTGISAESQQERSQHKNRSIAMTMLQTRIYNRILADQTSSERSMRSSQVGTGGRSEKIRTYNYQQDRITDHRRGRTVHGVPEYLLGSELLDEMVTSCVEGDQCQQVRERILEVYDKNRDSGR
eukprot:XP_797931.2 PREDICTED: peptide chain release factor 1-like, mitochondrial [Strongylocentrotus purpuratus]